MTQPTPPETPFADWNEELYAKTCAALVAPDLPASRARAWFWLALTLGLFVLSFLWSTELGALGLIVLVLLVHEAGHFAGMRAFGYRNVRMFFIPFFGAAVSGNKHAAPVWQQAIVLLLGPLPGIVVALLLVLTRHPTTDTWLGRLVLWLVIINALNLLPFVPLDGGRLLDLLLFSRRPVLAATFQGLAVLCLGALAWGTRAWPLWIVAGIVALAVPIRYRNALRARAFADNPWQFPERIEELADGQRRELFGWALLLNPLERAPGPLAESMRELHEHMVARRPSAAVWLALMLLYLGGWAAAVLALRQ
jgi:Zn-dependent protease